MFDKDEKIRKFFNMQYVKMKRMAAVGSLLLLAINLSFTVYPFVEHRFTEYVLGIPRVWFVIPILFLAITFLIWLGAHIYVRVMEMYRTEKRAEIILNPYNVYHFNPFQQMRFMHMFIPILESIYATMPEGEEKEKTKKTIEKVRRWAKEGYIPKDDFPQHLKKYYITDKEKRL